MKKFFIAFVPLLILTSLAFACEKDAVYQAALKAWVKFEMEEAFKLCNEVISKNPDCPNAYSLRGSILSEKYKYTEALSDFDTSLVINPSYVPSYLGRASVYYQLGKYKKSIDDYTYAIYLEHDDFSFYRRGRVYKASNDHLMAWIDYSVANFLDPKNIRYVSARDDFESDASRQNKRNIQKTADFAVKIARHRAYRAFKLDRKVEAIRLWEQILTNGAFIRDFYHTLAEISRLYSDEDNLESAEPFFIIAILYSEKFVPIDTVRISELYNLYSNFLNQIGREAESRKIKRKRLTM